MEPPRCAESFWGVFWCISMFWTCISMYIDVQWCVSMFWACISMVTEFVPPLILHFNSKYPYISDIQEYVFWVMFAFWVVSLISSQFLDQFLVFLCFWGVFWCISMFWTCISMYIDVWWCVSMFWACISMVTEFVPLILHFNSKYPYISDVREYVFWVKFAFGVVSLISSQFPDQFLFFLCFWGVFWCLSMFWTCISMYIDV